jgi:peroxidase
MTHTFRRKFNRAVLAGLFFLTAASQSMAQQASPSIPQQSGGIPLLAAFRPIGGVGNNLRNPSLNVVPGSAELSFAPLNFVPNTNDGVVAGPNPRTISNIIAGGTGMNGQTGQTTDPVLSAWLYVFGQFVDHDLDLEQTPPTSAEIDIAVPPGDPVFTAGTSIAMTRDARNATTNTIINTVAGSDLSQLYGSTPAIAASLANADGTLKSADTP